MKKIALPLAVLISFTVCGELYAQHQRQNANNNRRFFDGGNTIYGPKLNTLVGLNNFYGFNNLYSPFYGVPTFTSYGQLQNVNNDYGVRFGQPMKRLNGISPYIKTVDKEKLQKINQDQDNPTENPEPKETTEPKTELPPPTEPATIEPDPPHPPEESHCNLVLKNIYERTQEVANESCTRCHGGQRPRKGLNLENLQDLSPSVLKLVRDRVFEDNEDERMPPRTGITADQKMLFGLLYEYVKQTEKPEEQEK